MKVFIAYSDDFLNTKRKPAQLSIHGLKNITPTWDANQSIDESLDSFIRNLLAPIHLTALFIPLALSLDYTNFLGIRLALHIRFSQIEGLNPGIPIIFLGAETESEICRINPIGHFLFTAGVRLIPETKEAIEAAMQDLPVSLSTEYIRTTLVKLVRPEAPEFYDNRHAIANEWGLLRLDAMSGHHVLDDEPKLKEIRANLYIKWLLMKSDHQTRIHEQVKTVPFAVQGVKDKQILLIEDEWNKGWLKWFRAVFRHSQSEGATVDYVPISKTDTEKGLLDALNKKLAEQSYDLFIVDLRLTDGDHHAKNGEGDLVGIKVLEAIKKQNKGHQVLILSASNKFTNYDHARNKGADEVLVKPGMETAGTEKDFLQDLDRSVQRALNRWYLKRMWEKIQEIKKGVKQAQLAKGMAPLEEKAVFKFAVQAEIALTECWFHLVAPEQNVHLPYALLSLARLIEFYCIQEFVSKREKRGKNENKDTLVILNRNGEEQVVWRESKQVKGNAETLFEWDEITIQTRNEVGKGALFLLIRTNDFEDFHPGGKRPELTDFVIRQCVLIFRHGFNESTLRRYLELNELRNTQVAHISQTGQKDKPGVDIHDVWDMLEIVRGCMLFVSDENLKL